MNTSLDDHMDRLVAEFADRIQSDPSADGADLLEQVDEEHRAGLERCFRMIATGVVAAPRAAETLRPGTVLDGYRIVRELGRGGMAVVFLAEQLELKRLVALKVLRVGLALDQRHVDRFRREALAVAKLQHPNIVGVHGVGQALGYHYLAMEYVEGTNLAEVFERLPEGGGRTADDLAEAAGIPALAAGHHSFEQAFCDLMSNVARAIGLAHELGLVHRDVKPSNILIHKDGRAVIADFGLAKDGEDAGLSLTGEPLGTPSYMSPEQAALTSHEVDHRTDVYSLGVTLYEGLTGRRPFAGDTLLAVLEAIRTQTPPGLRAFHRERTREAEAVVRKAMERLPEERYSSCLDLATELKALAEGRATQAGAQDVGVLRGLRRGWRRRFNGQPYERISPVRFLGIPLYHVIGGPRLPGQKMRKAVGWYAAGDIAVGGLAFGTISYGLFAFGAISIGVVGWGGVAIGLFNFGGLAIGGFAHGGVALGFHAVGGLAMGYYAVGGMPVGTHTIGPEGQDPAAIEWIRGLGAWYRWVTMWMGMGGRGLHGQ